MPGLRKNEELAINWWTADTDLIPKAVFKQIDHNARRRIDTKIANSETYGNETDVVDGVTYECHWRIRKKKLTNG